MSTEKRAKQIEKLKKDVKDYTFEHNYKSKNKSLNNTCNFRGNI